MVINFKKRFNNFLNRDWIQKDEGKLTYVQLFGFILIALGVIYFSSFLLPSGIIDIFPFLKLDNHPESSEVPIAFFTIMLGISFAFPDMLKGQTKDISTMRIIVFMFANVICMLLLKIGWGKDVDSLDDIHLDGYWMGVIAFLFGAKATQSYFENANKIFTKPKPNPDTEDENKLGISQIAIAQIAKVQNEGKLRMRFPNIISVSDTLVNDIACLTLYLEDADEKDIPSLVPAEINKNTIIQIKTSTITNSGPGVVHIGQATDQLSDSKNSEGFASFCALVKNSDNPDLKFLVTAGHNFTKGNFKSMGGFVFGDNHRDVLINGIPNGKLIYQRMNFLQDLALVELKEPNDLFENYISFNNGYRDLSITDIKTHQPNITIASRKNEERNGSNIRDAYILDHNIEFNIEYNGEQVRMLNVILIGDSNDPQTSRMVSVRGDSGSCVFTKNTKELIGILVGGKGKFSYVLPIKEILEPKKFKLL